MKKILIIAGPNGAGKTTFAREFLPNEAACPEWHVIKQRGRDAYPYASISRGGHYGKISMGHVAP